MERAKNVGLVNFSRRWSYKMMKAIALNLLDKYDGSVANPAIRRCELMARIRALRMSVINSALSVNFYTITAPAKYHATVKNWSP